ncbi:hypothetical protein HIM_01127 [Hirsutella minnesotensis 3608]|nr:hypothetical protein HIM_01127 [Hirsutella minnesotensis 3608]
MVTFALPGDDNVEDATNGSPKPRPPLPFAKRSYASSPYASSFSKRNGTPRHASSRSNLLANAHDELPHSSLNNSSIAAARNIFRASTFSDSPPSTAFAPSLPQNTVKMFTAGSTPDPTRSFRQSTVQATPRGMASKVGDKELFTMRIPDPPPELSGEALLQKMPKSWDAKSPLYADQYLAHLCPPDLDEEQRRQFFCILDLRRLKYSANEIFAGKDWKLNVLNFAKEFDKSRGLILLHYGLYQFQHVKPSREVMKKWRRQHGLPDDEDEEIEPTPSQMASAKKRKATDDMSRDTAGAPTPSGKRRAMDNDMDDVAATPAPVKNKRKASPVEEQPSKLQKGTPSSAKSLLERIANNKPSSDSTTPKSNPFGATKGSTSLARSVLTNNKTFGAQSASSGNNIFGYLSDASSAKNSGIEADAESESETGSDDASPGTGHSDDPSVAASGAGETASQAGSGLFSKQPAVLGAGPAPDASSTPGTRESTPGRSLFERVTKGSDGQPVRADSGKDVSTEKPAAGLDQTWNPSTTPLKFASSAAPQKPPAFGQGAAAPASSVFAPKNTAATANFGFANHEAASAKASSAGVDAVERGKDGYESDKENESQSTKKSPVETKPASMQPNLGSTLFHSKSSTDVSEPSKSSPNPFGSTAQNASKAEAPTATNMFGSLNKSSGAAPAIQSTSLFGAKPTEGNAPTGNEASKPVSMFGGQASPSALGGASTATSIFGANKFTNTPTSGLSSGASTPSAPAPMFGSTSTAQPSSASAKPDAVVAPSAAPSSQPLFSFGAASNTAKPNSGTEAAAPKSLFGGLPKSPSATAPGSSLFGGSPMKQDEPSPAKRAFTGASAAESSSSTPLFSFGNAQPVNSAAPAGNLFGATPASTTASPATTAAPFGSGAASTAPASGGFNFNFTAGGASNTPSSPFNNPFAKGNDAPAGGAPSFQFGSNNANGTASAPSSGAIFGAGQASGSSTPAFGGASAPSGGPIFSFSGAASQPSQATAPMFGSTPAAPVFGGLQPPAGGSSTTGTNSPLNIGGGSSLATTPAAGTPEPSNQNQAEGAAGGDPEEGEKHEQINLTDVADSDEENLHEVRAKVLKFVPPGDKSDSDGKAKSKSPWATQGVGPLRLLKHRESAKVRLLLRAEPRGHVVLNRSLLPNMSYKADEKYVKITTSNEAGDGLETWMIQVKTKDLAKSLAEALEKHKELNMQ